MILSHVGESELYCRQVARRLLIPRRNAERRLSHRELRRFGRFVWFCRSRTSVSRAFDQHPRPSVRNLRGLNPRPAKHTVTLLMFARHGPQSADSSTSLSASDEQPSITSAHQQSISRSIIRPPPSGRLATLSRFGAVFHTAVGTGVEPVTARFTVWCSTH